VRSGGGVRSTVHSRAGAGHDGDVASEVEGSGWCGHDGLVFGKFVGMDILFVKLGLERRAIHLALVYI
jgi:hypothetical protein